MDDVTFHEIFQADFRLRLDLSETASISECIELILDDEEIRYSAVEATELLFGCEMNNLPARNENPALWDLFNGLWDGDDLELIKTIAKNHEWTNRESARGNALCFQIYEGEFLLITGDAIDPVFNFMSRL